MRILHRVRRREKDGEAAGRKNVEGKERYMQEGME